MLIESDGIFRGIQDFLNQKRGTFGRVPEPPGHVPEPIWDSTRIECTILNSAGDVEIQIGDPNLALNRGS